MLPLRPPEIAPVATENTTVKQVLYIMLTEKRVILANKKGFSVAEWLTGPSAKTRVDGSNLRVKVFFFFFFFEPMTSLQKLLAQSRSFKVFCTNHGPSRVLSNCRVLAPDTCI